MRPRFHSIPVLTICFALILSLGGCGGSDDEPLSKAEFIKQGDAICTKIDAEKGAKIRAFLKEAGANEGKPLSVAQQEEMTVTAVLPPIRRIGGELEDLGVPDEARAEKIVAELMKAVAEVEKDPVGSQKDGDPFAEVADQAGDYGFKACILYY